MTIFVLAFILGCVAGLRAMTAPAAAAWAIKLGYLSVENTPIAFMGYAHTAWVFTAVAIAELVNDKLPWTPSRKVPPQFIGRVLSGGLVGACIGWGTGVVVEAILLGIAGAVVGTLYGAKARGILAAKFGKDLPAALIEDAVAVGVAIAVVFALGQR